MSEQVKHFPSFEIRTSIKLITRIQFKSKRKFAFLFGCNVETSST